MKIVVNYSNIWKNSFLDGDNNSPVDIKKGRKYTSSSTELKKSENHQVRDITHNTVMGLLNRLIGDQRKLYQARNKEYEDTYYFEEIEDKVTFEKKKTIISKESIFLRNLKKDNYDRSAWTGIINDNHPLLSSNFSRRLFSIFDYTLEEIVDFILTGKEYESPDFLISSLNIKETCEKKINKLKAIEVTDSLKEVLDVLNNTFKDVNYLSKKELIYTSKLYYSALYIMLNNIQEESDISDALTKNGNISGISKGNFTAKDFMKSFTEGKKIIYGNPYKTNYWKDSEVEGGKKKKIEELISVESGILEINIDIDKDKARELRDLIDDAAVGTFYLGKKGLAYVQRIKI